MDSSSLPNYNMNEQIYESSDKSIKIYKVNNYLNNTDKKKIFYSIYSCKNDYQKNSS